MNKIAVLNSDSKNRQPFSEWKCHSASSVSRGVISHEALEQFFPRSPPPPNEKLDRLYMALIMNWGTSWAEEYWGLESLLVCSWPSSSVCLSKLGVVVFAEFQDRRCPSENKEQMEGVFISLEAKPEWWQNKHTSQPSRSERKKVSKDTHSHCLYRIHEKLWYYMPTKVKEISFTLSKLNLVAWFSNYPFLWTTRSGSGFF